MSSPEVPVLQGWEVRTVAGARKKAATQTAPPLRRDEKEGDCSLELEDILGT